MTRWNSLPLPVRLAILDALESKRVREALLAEYLRHGDQLNPSEIWAKPAATEMARQAIEAAIEVLEP